MSTRVLHILILLILSAAAVGLWNMPNVVHADPAGPCSAFDDRGCTAFVPLAETSGSKLGQMYSTSGDLSNFINGLFKFAIAIGAILAVLRLAYAGYLYMGQADMWSSKGRAREVIKDVTLGLLLLLSIYLILFQINPNILKLKALDVLKNNAAQSQTPSGASGASFTDEPGFNGIGTTLPGGTSPGDMGVYNNAAAVPRGAWCYPIGTQFECAGNSTACTDSLNYEKSQAANPGSLPASCTQR